MRKRRADLSKFALLKITHIKFSHSIFIEMKISFLHYIIQLLTIESLNMM